MKCNLLARTALAVALTGAAAAAHAEQAASGPNHNASDPLVATPDDWAGYAHVGYHLDPHWRVELRGGYRADATGSAASAQGAVRGLCADPMAGAACDPRSRALGAYSAIANLIFDVMPDSRWVDPFFGVGAGVSRLDQNPIGLASPAIGLLRMNAGAAQLGYQAIVGLAFRPRDRLHFDLTYRWRGDAGPALGGQPTMFNGDFSDQAVAFSIGYALSTPRAAVPPAPAIRTLEPNISAGPR